VRDPRREVEHIPGFEHPLLIGFEIGKNGDVEVLDEGLDLDRCRVDLPAALPEPLQQEDVVVVDVCSDAPSSGA
jgi:hypothetical protein